VGEAGQEIGQAVAGDASRLGTRSTAGEFLPGWIVEEYEGRIDEGGGRFAVRGARSRDELAQGRVALGEDGVQRRENRRLVPTEAHPGGEESVSREHRLRE